jgi:hypothetical protein
MSTFNDPDLPEGTAHGEEHIHPERVDNPEVSYDRTDMSAKAIVGFFIFLAIAGIFMHLILWGLYKRFAGAYKADTQLANPIYSSTRQLPGDPVRSFPAPRLQPDDVADMNKFRADEEIILNTYDWVDQQQGTVRVPIEQAIKALAQQGLPVRPEPPDNAGVELQQAPTPGSGGAMTQQRVSQPSEMVK